MDDQEIRAAAVIAAAAAHPWDGETPHKLIAYAGRLVPWIAGKVTTGIILTASADGIAVAVNPPSGGEMAQTVAATVDNTTVTLVAQPEDDHNDPTPDLLTWTNDDTASAVAAWVLVTGHAHLHRHPQPRRGHRQHHRDGPDGAEPGPHRGHPDHRPGRHQPGQRHGHGGLATPACG